MEIYPQLILRLGLREFLSPASFQPSSIIPLLESPFVQWSPFHPIQPLWDGCTKGLQLEVGASSIHYIAVWRLPLMGVLSCFHIVVYSLLFPIFSIFPCCSLLFNIVPCCSLLLPVVPYFTLLLPIIMLMIILMMMLMMAVT